MKTIISLLILSLIKLNLTVSKCRVIIREDGIFTQTPIVMGKLYEDPIFEIINVNSLNMNKKITFNLITNSNDADFYKIKRYKLYIVRGFKKKRNKYYKVLYSFDKEYVVNDTNSVLVTPNDEIILIEKDKKEGFCYNFH